MYIILLLIRKFSRGLYFRETSHIFRENKTPTTFVLSIFKLPLKTGFTVYISDYKPHQMNILNIVVSILMHQ